MSTLRLVHSSTGETAPAGKVNYYAKADRRLYQKDEAGTEEQVGTGATPGAHAHAQADVTGLPAALAAKADLVGGVVPISQLPAAVVERLVVVANQAARFALTTATVQLGDTVKESDTGFMFLVKDEANLNNAAGYEQYTAGQAAAVPWSGVTGKPTTLGGYGITDGQPLDADLTALAGLSTAADKLPYFTGPGAAALTTLSAAGRALIDDADAATMQATLGLGTMATQAANNVAITGGAITGATLDGYTGDERELYVWFMC